MASCPDQMSHKESSSLRKKYAEDVSRTQI